MNSKQAEEMIKADRMIRDNNSSRPLLPFLGTSILVSLPVFLFDILWYLAYGLASQLGISKSLHYGILITVFQVLWLIPTGGYGTLAIPASVLSFVVLVYVL